MRGRGLPYRCGNSIFYGTSASFVLSLWIWFTLSPKWLRISPNSEPIYQQWVYVTIRHNETPWWRNQMETFFALLAICAGNSPVTDEFPAQRPVTRSFDVFVDLRLNKRLSKQSWGWWFKTLTRPWWHRCNDRETKAVHYRYVATVMGTCNRQSIAIYESPIFMWTTFLFVAQYHIKAETQRPLFSRRHFQMHFLDKISLPFLPRGPINNIPALV